MNKTNWNSELSSWSDEDFIRIFHEHPNLADRLRKVLAKPMRVPKGYVLVAENCLEELIGSDLMDQLRQSCRFPTSKHIPSTQTLSDEYKDILKECRNKAMYWTMYGRIPECGVFSQIAQDLDYLCDQLGIDNDQ
ncbi:hypothetical protein ZC03_071 [Pseudomonas phage ZC03]|uniref:Uncharacterized protein n=2 Tax=Zicotriavirus TaxID=2843161 RepID=A0A1L2C974_9CAUD|nr:hypothetical protein HWA93_gp58 [Pseudomonas phage ZC03]YP_009830628.1 hypothetical protein HWA94_gp60 [Pseudomonas phage ZC08]AMD43448.1 hypothetical protein ZC03_071 [Pseudomonas phage ZC03]AMD43499.1 hypothetical protein ZC08_066 [Pseudomonas phage ZC08]